MVHVVRHICIWYYKSRGSSRGTLSDVGGVGLPSRGGQSTARPSGLNTLTYSSGPFPVLSETPVVFSVTSGDFPFSCRSSTAQYSVVPWTPKPRPPFPVTLLFGVSSCVMFDDGTVHLFLSF